MDSRELKGCFSATIGEISGESTLRLFPQITQIFAD